MIEKQSQDEEREEEAVPWPGGASAWTDTKARMALMDGKPVIEQ